MTRLAPTLCVCLSLAACSSSGKSPSNTKSFTFRDAVNRDVDVLFMIDNSGATGALKYKLAATFPAFIDRLRALPGGLPNLHMAVVSSDMGAGPYDAVDIPNCNPGGDEGVFQSAPTDTAACAMGSLEPGKTFITANGTGAADNYTGDLAGALACISNLGDLGCAFEHPFASVLRALGADGRPAPATNAGFLRPNALLFIVLLTNEDDCSAPPDSMLFSPASRFASDPLGPLSSFRCNEFGHDCGGERPPRTPAASGTDLSGTCKSNEDGTLLRVSDAVSRLKALKTAASMIFVTAIAGPPSPYVVELEPATLKDDPIQAWPQIRHSCTSATEFANPAVRIDEWVRGFGDDGQFHAACSDSYVPAMTAVGQQVEKALSGVACLASSIDQRKCTAEERTFDDRGTPTDTPLPNCLTNGDELPCWRTETSPECPDGKRIIIGRPPGAPPVDHSITFTCPS